MNFEEALAQTPPTNMSRCKTGIWIKQQDQNTQHQILEAVKTTTVKRVWIASKSIGFDGSVASMERHFNGSCRCNR